MRRHVITLSLAVVTLSSIVTAAPVQWAVGGGGNGHYYELVENIGLTWYEAQIEAESLSHMGVTGHLATITSAAENTFLVSALLGEAPAWGYYIGGYQPAGSPEPDGNWQWITGEAWTYANWWPPVEPNNSPPGEEALLIYTDLYPDPGSLGTWNDVNGNDPSNWRGSYIVEFTPEPSSLLLLIGGLPILRRRSR